MQASRRQDVLGRGAPRQDPPSGAPPRRAGHGRRGVVSRSATAPGRWASGWRREPPPVRCAGWCWWEGWSRWRQGWSWGPDPPHTVASQRVMERIGMLEEAGW